MASKLDGKPGGRSAGTQKKIPAFLAGGSMKGHDLVAQ
jgi:hypothetical protein